MTRCACSNPVSDTHDLSLSPYQQQFFQGWMRATDAIPPPSASTGNRNGIGPLMSSSCTIDLVQDAASDCSVVTSLCAAIARTERGHDQVGTLAQELISYVDIIRCSRIKSIPLTNILASPSSRPTENILYVSTLMVVGGKWLSMIDYQCLKRIDHCTSSTGRTQRYCGPRY